MLSMDAGIAGLLSVTPPGLFHFYLAGFFMPCCAWLRLSLHPLFVWLAEYDCMCVTWSVGWNDQASGVRCRNFSAGNKIGGCAVTHTVDANVWYSALRNRPVFIPVNVIIQFIFER